MSVDEIKKSKILKRIKNEIRCRINPDDIVAHELKKYSNCPNFILEVLKAESDSDYNFFNSLDYASKTLKCDMNFMLQAAQVIGFKRSNELTCSSYFNLSEETINKITNCKKTLIQFLEAGIYLFDKACLILRDDKDVALAAAKFNFVTLKDASDRLRDDEDVVFAATSVKTYNFKFASNRLKNDKDFVLKCLKIDKGAFLLYVSNELLSNKDFIKQAVKIKHFALQYATDSLQSDIELNYLAYKDNIEEFYCVSHSIQLKALTCLYENRDKYEGEKK